MSQPLDSFSKPLATAMDKIISSRTPEGDPNHCPICDALICIEPSQPAGDAPCPTCGALLWFVKISEGIRFHDSAEAAPITERLFELIRKRLGAIRPPLTASTSFSEDVGIDSLDIVELVMALEEEFEVTISEEDAEQLKTVGEVIDFILRHRPI
jgi:acyl carrier protein